MDNTPSGTSTQFPRLLSSNSFQGAGPEVFSAANWHHKSIKRPRPVKSCTECRRRKLKCDRQVPCSQCQRSSYRSCTYGSGNDNGSTGSGGESGDRHNNDPNDQNGDSEASEGSAIDDTSACGSLSDGRPLKQRHLDRISQNVSGGGQRPRPTQALSSSSGSSTSSGTVPTKGPSRSSTRTRPSLSSSLSILLNPTPAKPDTKSPPPPPPPPPRDQAPPPFGTHIAPPRGPVIPQVQPVPSVSPAPATILAPPPTVSQGISPSTGLHPAMKQVSMTLGNPGHWMSLSGDELREYSAALTKEFMARMERLEKLALAKNASVLTAMPPFPSSSVLSQLHRHHNPHHPPRRVIDSSSKTLRSLSIKGRHSERSRYFGSSDSRVLLNLFDDAKDFMADPANRRSIGGMLWRLERIHGAVQEEQSATLRPMTVYVDSMLPLHKRMADLLPRRQVCDRLFRDYVNIFESSLFRVSHVPTFQDEIDKYWTHGLNPSQGGVGEDFLPRYLSALCIGSRCNADTNTDRSNGIHVPTACALVRSWHDSIRGRPTMEMNVIRSEVLLLHATCMTMAQSQMLWKELGFIARLAMMMGLHREPSECVPAMPPFEAECRRKLWFTIIDMDLHVSLATNLPRAIRPGEFTCQPPRNLDDADIFPKIPSLPAAKPMHLYTEGQVQRFAADTLPLRMRACDLLCHIDSLTDYVEVLAIGGELEKVLDDINTFLPRYHNIETPSQYKQWIVRAALDIHVRQPLLALYRPFALSASDACPPPSAISDCYLKSSMAILTYMQDLDPGMPWYNDMMHMHYVVLRSDVVQAAFSVCYYIIQAIEAEGLPTPATAPLHDLSLEENKSGGSDSSGHAKAKAKRRHVRVPLIWSAAYMIQTVEHTIDNLARLVAEVGSDLRAVIALATVLGSVKPAADPVQRNDHIRAQIARVLDICVEKLQGHASPAVRAAIGIGHAEWNAPGEPREGSDPWETDFWDLWNFTNS